MGIDFLEEAKRLSKRIKNTAANLTTDKLKVSVLCNNYKTNKQIHLIYILSKKQNQQGLP